MTHTKQRQRHPSSYTKYGRAQSAIERVGSATRHTLRCIKQGRPDAFVSILGCTRYEFKAYLEKKFSTGMTWDNHGRYGWHVDHIVPYAAYNLSKESEIFAVGHYKNTQPMWSKENLAKNSFIYVSVSSDSKPVNQA